MNYFGQLAVDDAHHLITAAMTDFIDQRYAQCLPRIVEQSRQNLADNDIHMEQILAVAGYSSGETPAYLHEQGLDAWIPNFGQYVPHRPGFEYDRDLNRYSCVKPGGNGAILSYKGERIDSKGYTKRTYQSSESDCGRYPLRESCCGARTMFKKIDDSIHKEHYDRMHEKLTKQPE